MYNYSGLPSENVTVPEWKDYAKEKPFFAAGKCVEHPLFWCEKPTLI